MKIPSDEVLAGGLGCIVTETGISVTDQRRIADMKLLSTRMVLNLELQGIKLNANYNAHVTVKKMFDLRGSRQSVFDQFDAFVTERTGIASRKK